MVERQLLAALLPWLLSHMKIWIKML